MELWSREQVTGQVFAEAVQAEDKASWEVYPKVFGNRIPKDYFVTAGRGDTDIGPGDDPWEFCLP